MCTFTPALLKETLKREQLIDHHLKERNPVQVCYVIQKTIDRIFLYILKVNWAVVVVSPNL